MKLQVVCRGSTKEGLGHLFRTRTFAKTAQLNHQVSVVAIVEPDLQVIFSELDCPVYFAEREQDILPLVQTNPADVLIFDLTHLDKDIFQRVTHIPRLTASISPIFEHIPQIDVLFTRTARAPQIPGVQIYGGLQYAIFNEHCQTITDDTFIQNLKLPELSIAVCMGGTDAANKTLAVLKALMHVPDSCTIWVLLGEGYAHSYNALVETARYNPRHEVILAKTGRSMWRVMSNCVLAILAGGLTTVEAICAGLPTINLFERSEHIDVISQELFELGVCLNGGVFSDTTLTTMVTTVKHLYHKRQQIYAMHQRTKGLVDTDGSKRVLRKLEQHLTLATRQLVLARNGQY